MKCSNHKFDVIPDMISVIGLLDDASVIGLVLSTLRKESNACIVWKQENDPTDRTFEQK